MTCLSTHKRKKRKLNKQSWLAYCRRKEICPTCMLNFFDDDDIGLYPYNGKYRICRACNTEVFVFNKRFIIAEKPTGYTGYPFNQI